MDAPETGDAGCIVFGAPPEELGLALTAHSQRRPRPGHLMLFPSYVWHGTGPTPVGERLTVAFDAVAL